MANAGSNTMETEIIWIKGESGAVRANHSLKVPEFEERNELRKDDDDNFGLVWKPCAWLRDARLKVYLAKAKKLKIEEELALEMLLANDYNAEESIKDLQNWKNEHRHQLWGKVEQHKFEKLYSTHGKKFTEIQKHFPETSVGELIKYYLNWKRKNGIANRIYAHQKQKQQDVKDNLEFDRKPWDQLP
ncbi:unnamed protein product [Orchesella dallaii]|uniref:SANT domain-containing protein n=1 Tax=Orchesella dallaii TaxID=48710 RepID=A0ABP1QJ81_9HEXA